MLSNIKFVEQSREQQNKAVMNRCNMAKRFNEEVAQGWGDTLKSHAKVTSYIPGTRGRHFVLP